MPDKVTVIKAFDNLSRFVDTNVHPIVSPDNWNIYSQLRDMIDLIAEDTLTLLKEQEARLLTLEEVKAFDWDYCYLEEERLPGIEYRAVCGDYALTCITWPCVTSMRIQHGDESYGRKWRCWSAKPTDRQRQEVKWQ